MHVPTAAAERERRSCFVADGEVSRWDRVDAAPVRDWPVLAPAFRFVGFEMAAKGWEP